jgi:hypothetical protein
MHPRWIWIVLLAFVLGACANAGSQRFAGRKTKPASRVAVVPGGPHQAHWQTRDLTLTFDYQWEAGRFDIAGSVELSQKLQHFTILDNLRIRLHFLDAEGVILSTYNVWNSGNQENMHYHFVYWKYDKRYTPPDGTTMIGFSYTGEVSDAGGDGLARRSGGGRGEWSFWWQP